MKKSTLLLVKANAQLLISRIDKALYASGQEEERRLLSNKTNFDVWEYTPLKRDNIHLFPKLLGDVKRTSMELTRSLADLRQNR